MTPEIKSKEELIQEHHMIQHGMSVGKAHSHADLTLEYAEQQATQFMEWVDGLLYNNILQRARARSSSFYGKWVYSPPYKDEQMLTTAELYQLFKQQSK